MPISRPRQVANTRPTRDFLIDDQAAAPAAEEVGQSNTSSPGLDILPCQSDDPLSARGEEQLTKLRKQGRRLGLDFDLEIKGIS